MDMASRSKYGKVASPESLLIHFNIQSTLVISTSVISNNRLSRREYLIPVLT